MRRKMISEGMLDILAKREEKRIEREEVYEKLFDKYGDMQVIVAIEELSELQKELCKLLRNKGKKENIIEEVADVTIMLEQIKFFFNIDDEVEKIVDEKIERTKERLL
jgi:protein tyrosine phosphatase